MGSQEENFALRRSEMVSRHLRARSITRGDLLEAFGDIPRERFIPPDQQRHAYGDFPLPIGRGQTISQPYVVALMIQELDPRPGDRVLDVGAGSGYQTAILARLSAWVYAVERIEELADRAGTTLAGLDVKNVTIRTADGSTGWAEEAPFDRIICGAGAPKVPQPWIDQLADGGRIVLPVGERDVQTLVVLDKHEGQVRRRRLCDVRFVKLIGQQAWQEE